MVRGELRPRLLPDQGSSMTSAGRAGRSGCRGRCGWGVHGAHVAAQQGSHPEKCVFLGNLRQGCRAASHPRVLTKVYGVGSSWWRHGGQGTRGGNWG